MPSTKHIIRPRKPTNYPAPAWGAAPITPANAGPGERIYQGEGEYVFTYPAGAPSLQVTMIGPGAGGGAPASGTGGGGGGGGGGYAKALVPAAAITFGGEMKVTIGYYGEGQTKESGDNGFTCSFTDGVTSLIGIDVLPFGGNKNGTGGTGGGCFVADGVVLLDSATGAAGGAGSKTGGGAGGAAGGPLGGAGGKGTTTGTGGDGVGPGGGGGGTKLSGGTGIGGDGGVGWVRIVWPPE